MQGIWRSVSEKQNYNQYNDLISNWSAQNLFSTCLDLTKKNNGTKCKCKKQKQIWGQAFTLKICVVQMCNTVPI